MPLDNTVTPERVSRHAASRGRVEARPTYIAALGTIKEGSRQSYFVMCQC